jgi:tetratricopeptide (TPR) repeat protein
MKPKYAGRRIFIIAALVTAMLLSFSGHACGEAKSDIRSIEQMLAKGEVDKAAILAREAQKKGDRDSAEMVAMVSVAANKRGWDAACSRNFPEAVKYLELAVSLLPDDGTYQSTLELVRKGQQKWAEVQRLAGLCEKSIAEKRLKDAEKHLLTIREIDTAMGIPGEMQSSLITDLAKRYAEACRLESQQAGGNQQVKPQSGQGASTAAMISASDYFNCGLLKGMAGDHCGAVDNFTKAIDLNPAYTEAYFNRAFDRKESGDIKGALEDYEKTIALNPGHYKAYYNRGNIYRERGDPERAMAEYSECISRSGSFFWAYYNRALCRFSRKDYKGAAADFSVFIDNTPPHSDAYYNRGLCREMLGDFKGALSDYRKAFEMNPGNGQAKAAVERLRNR